jgi:hypothetical protein
VTLPPDSGFRVPENTKPVPNADRDPGGFLAAAGTDAMLWAVEFCRLFQVTRRDDGKPMDEGLMVGWFANALAAGELAPRAAST